MRYASRRDQKQWYVFVGANFKKSSGFFLGTRFAHRTPTSTDRLVCDHTIGDPRITAVYRPKSWQKW